MPYRRALRGAQVKHGPQPYAHVKASMVRLPFACSIGRESLLQTLVESDVPVQVCSRPWCCGLRCRGSQFPDPLCFGLLD